MMPASKRQRTYEDVFREFVQSSLDEEKKRSPAPSSGGDGAATESPQKNFVPAEAAGAAGDGAEAAAADDAADAAGADDAGAAAGDGGSVAAPPGRRGRGRGRRRRGGLGRGRSSVGGDGDGGSSGSEREGAEERSPPIKRACGRGRGRGRGRPKLDLGSSSSSSSDRTEPAADAAPNTGSNGPGQWQLSAYDQLGQSTADRTLLEFCHIFILPRFCLIVRLCPEVDYDIFTTVRSMVPEI